MTLLPGPGLTSAAFSLAQSVTAVPWGRAADRYGRKPVLVVGLLSTMVCFIIWGLSTSLPMAITVRAIQGGGNGNGMFLPINLPSLSLPPQTHTHTQRNLQFG